MKLLLCLLFLSLAVLVVESAIWCGYPQCTKNCKEKSGGKGCRRCLCTCGNSTCMVGYYCLYGLVRQNDVYSKPKCCSSTVNSPDRVCLLPGEKNVANALPYIP